MYIHIVFHSVLDIVCKSEHAFAMFIRIREYDIVRKFGNHDN